MARLSAVVWVLFVCLFSAIDADAEDRVVSIGQSPNSAEMDAAGGHGMLVDLVHALDKATNSSSRIVLYPFARSLKETAAGRADLHIPFIQKEGSPAPDGLAYVTEVDFGQVQFVIYSRKLHPLNAVAVAGARNIETEPGHESFFPFPVRTTYCVPCSLEKVMLGRVDALIVPADVVDPLLSDPKYKAIHRALYQMFPVRALVPVNANSAATRHYLIDGVRRLKESGDMWKITKHNVLYSDWQP